MTRLSSAGGRILGARSDFERTVSRALCESGKPAPYGSYRRSQISAEARATRRAALTCTSLFWRNSGFLAETGAPVGSAPDGGGALRRTCCRSTPRPDQSSRCCVAVERNAALPFISQADHIPAVLLWLVIECLG